MARGLESVAHMPAAAPKKPPKKLDHMRVEEAENGGHTVTHHFTHYEHNPEQHVFGKGEGNELLMHIAKHGNVDHSLAAAKDNEPGHAEGEESAAEQAAETKSGIEA